MNDLKLTEIWIYPIKSMGGVSLSDANVLPKGLAYDRRWMLVDENGLFLSQRTLPQLALFQIGIQKGFLEIVYHDSAIKIEASPTRLADSLSVKIWDDTVLAYEVNSEVSEWFTQILKIPCRLVYFPDENPRLVDPNYHINYENVSLADAYPFLIIGQRSLDDLNTKLKKPLPMNRFRPNFVFTGGEAFCEDSWKEFSIGSGLFAAVKPCARCTVTTIDQRSGQRSAEPLKTLATYRAKNNKIYFGQNLVMLQAHKVSVGDTIAINTFLNI